ncbi:hypothetical protein NEF87_002524 [Candidatus Lokiarchaeum ossiferum]|uniref:N-acetyltransferase domain-containing protein n=1 Tax=Candidatus Lokiarchaeum ossiferum TaxID=2951803 RepID=A0ABY6HRV7_9ARCH|nr:hypothetical protein NEF87_002524 [Candidatus Lokiarchaeum sp. B-35]
MASKTLSYFIIGERIAFRPLKEKNIHLYSKWVNNPKNRAFIPYHFPTTYEIRQKWVQRQQFNGTTSKIILEIWHLHDKQAIGYAQLDEISWIDRKATMGYIIGENQYWKKGLGTETIQLLETYAFEELNLRKLKALVIRDNLASVKVFEKLKYRLEGVLEGENFYLGNFRDVFIFSKFKNIE